MPLGKLIELDIYLSNSVFGYSERGSETFQSDSDISNNDVWKNETSFIMSSYIYLVPCPDATPLVIISKENFKDTKYTFLIENNANIYLLIGILGELFYL